MSLTGRQLKDRDDGLNMNTVLDGITSKKPFYDEARPALCAIIWGFCREGRLVPVDEDGNTLENSAVLDQDHLSTTRFETASPRADREAPRIGGFKQTTETVTDGLINLQEANQQLRSRLLDFRKTSSWFWIRTFTRGSLRLLEAFIEELTDRTSTTTERLSVVRSQGNGLADAIEQTNDDARVVR